MIGRCFVLRDCVPSCLVLCYDFDGVACALPVCYTALSATLFSVLAQIHPSPSPSRWSALSVWQNPDRCLAQVHGNPLALWAGTRKVTPDTLPPAACVLPCPYISPLAHTLQSSAAWPDSSEGALLYAWLLLLRDVACAPTLLRLVVTVLVLTIGLPRTARR